jgi:predicted DCC family thiol-disulfide oxidoreductase YuxK
VRLTVLFDPSCPLCRWLRSWIETQAQLVALDFVAAGSADARRRFPSLDAETTTKELHVIGDDGSLYVGEPAYIAVLWALEEHRALSYRLSSGPLRGIAKSTLALLSKYRPREGVCNTACDA